MRVVASGKTGASRISPYLRKRKIRRHPFLALCAIWGGLFIAGSSGSSICVVVPQNLEGGQTEIPLSLVKGLADIQGAADLHLQDNLTDLPGAFEELVHEHLERRLRYTLYRRIEARRWIQARAAGGVCLVLHRNCSSDVWPVRFRRRGFGAGGHPNTWDKEAYKWGGGHGECLVVGRQIADIVFKDDLTELLGSTSLNVLALAGGWAKWSAKERSTATEVASSALRPGGRLLVLKSSDIASGILGEARDVARRNGLHAIRSADSDGFLCRDEDPICAIAARFASPSPSRVIMEALKPFDSGTSTSQDPRLLASIVAKTYVVNLARRPDKWEAFVANAAAAGFVDYERFSAVDGRLVSLTGPLMKFFSTRILPEIVSNPHEDHGFRRGVIGCSLSHLAIWTELSARSDLSEVDGYLILEDDAEMREAHGAGTGFAEEWARLHARLCRDPRWDLLYIGFSDDTMLYSPHDEFFVHPGVRLFGYSGHRSYGGGTFGYFIRKRGARKLRRRALKYGMSQPIDWFMIESLKAGVLIAYIASPHLVVTTPVQYDGSDTYEPYPYREFQRKCALLMRSAHNESGDISSSTKSKHTRAEVTRQARIGLQGLSLESPGQGTCVVADTIVKSTLIANNTTGIFDRHTATCSDRHFSDWFIALQGFGWLKNYQHQYQTLLEECSNVCFRASIIGGNAKGEVLTSAMPTMIGDGLRRADNDISSTESSSPLVCRRLSDTNDLHLWAPYTAAKGVKAYASGAGSGAVRHRLHLQAALYDGVGLKIPEAEQAVQFTVRPPAQLQVDLRYTTNSATEKSTLLQIVVAIKVPELAHFFGTHAASSLCIMAIANDTYDEALPLWCSTISTLSSADLKWQRVRLGLKSWCRSEAECPHDGSSSVVGSHCAESKRRCFLMVVLKDVQDEIVASAMFSEPALCMEEPQTNEKGGASPRACSFGRQILLGFTYSQDEACF